jgi:PKD repeat protein
VTRSEITNNGIGIDNWWGAIQVSYSNITGNDVGMNFNGHPQTVENNNISGNITYNAKVTGGANRLALNNWWGTINPVEIDSKIYDGRDNATLGLLTFTPFRSIPISLNNSQPTADAGQNKILIINEVAGFDCSASFDPDGSIVNCQWDFGDGTGTNGAITTHKYESPGTLTVTLTVYDDQGASANDSAAVTVLSIAQAIQTLSETVTALNLPQGISNSLVAKLEAASRALQAGNLRQGHDAMNYLTAFINEVEAQRGKSLSNLQADTLVSLARRTLA